jgi:hypothetical protein
LPRSRKDFGWIGCIGLKIGPLGLDKSSHLAHRLGLMTITTTAIGQLRVSRRWGFRRNCGTVIADNVGAALT